MTTKTGPQPAPKTIQEALQNRRQEPREEQRRDQAQLVRCYGAIGISAVAAALRYAGVSKNPAYAPVAHRKETRFAGQVA